MKDNLIIWHNRFNERQKIQHIYLLITVISFALASVISLVDAHLGRRVLYITAAALGIFLINAVVWSVLFSSLLVDLKTPRTRR